ncbi:hypothetical protein BKA70DRAFT_1231451 [Coprinopsis sp. MPI-PUGE-AT-0042]|nr:hypothetical protein BKA70DRAFT_1231451 [Coprinopsis sp. MPI-PUGE-AT-0042]
MHREEVVVNGKAVDTVNMIVERRIGDAPSHGTCRTGFLRPLFLRQNGASRARLLAASFRLLGNALVESMKITPPGAGMVLKALGWIMTGAAPLADRKETDANNETNLLERVVPQKTGIPQQQATRDHAHAPKVRRKHDGSAICTAGPILSGSGGEIGTTRAEGGRNRDPVVLLSSSGYVVLGKSIQHLIRMTALEVPKWVTPMLALLLSESFSRLEVFLQTEQSTGVWNDLSTASSLPAEVRIRNSREKGTDLLLVTGGILGLCSFVRIDLCGVLGPGSRDIECHYTYTRLQLRYEELVFAANGAPRAKRKTFSLDPGSRRIKGKKIQEWFQTYRGVRYEQVGFRYQ